MKSKWTVPTYAASWTEGLKLERAEKAVPATERGLDTYLPDLDTDTVFFCFQVCLFLGNVLDMRPPRAQRPASSCKDQAL